jgi:Myelodysplasia-myeloid leukemia factor 1-interacting protein
MKKRSQSKPVGSQMQMYHGEKDMFGSVQNQMMSRMQQMMGGFGGFGSVFDDLDDFGFGFGGARRPRDRPAQRDPFSNILSRFDDFGTDFDMMNSNSSASRPSGNFVSQTLVYSQKVGPDGKPQVEKYFKSDIGGRNSDGKMIKHGEEMYKNTATGVKKIAQERVLDGKGHKAVKTKLGNGDEEIQNTFHGLEENDQADFHRRWEDESKRLGLEKLASQLPKQHALESHLKRSNYGSVKALPIEGGDSQSTTPSQVSRRSGLHPPAKPSSRSKKA